MGYDKKDPRAAPAWVEKNDAVERVYKEIVAIVEQSFTKHPGFVDLGRKNLSADQWVRIIEKLFAEFEWTKDAFFITHGDFKAKFGFGVRPANSAWFPVDSNNIAAVIASVDKTSYDRAPDARD